MTNKMLTGLLAMLTCVGCTPRIEVVAPKAPLTINMNVNVEHEIYIKADSNMTPLLPKITNDTATKTTAPVSPAGRKMPSRAEKRVKSF